MKHTTVATLFVLISLISSTAALAQPALPQHIVGENSPAVQPVTGEELRDTRDTLLLLLLQMTGIVPQGRVPLLIDECEISSVADFVETETRRVAPGVTGCDLETYAGICQIAASRHRRTCAETCTEFQVIGDARDCSSDDHPTVEAFYPTRHCRVHPELGTTMTCVVSGWCNCNP